jgi:hypothetical protein
LFKLLLQQRRFLFEDEPETDWWLAVVCTQVNRHDISQEAHLLQVVITELRGPGGTKRIFGMVVDRAMLSNIFGGVLAMLYVVRKTPLFEPFIYFKPNILPRQARDKHRESTQKRVLAFFAGSQEHGRWNLAHLAAALADEDGSGADRGIRRWRGREPDGWWWREQLEWRRRRERWRLA